MGVPLGSGFRVISWSARGLLCLSPFARRKKLKLLAQILAQAHIVHVQEAHGSEAGIEQFSRAISVIFGFMGLSLKVRLGGAHFRRQGIL